MRTGGLVKNYLNRTIIAYCDESIRILQINYNIKRDVERGTRVRTESIRNYAQSINDQINLLKQWSVS